MVLCLLATDDEEDVALQIHFTLIQAFCCENDINILRVSNMRRLAEILGGVKPGGEPMDLHCVLVTVSVITHACLLSHFCALLTSLQTVTRVVVAQSEPVLLLAPRSLSAPAWSCCVIWIICNLFALKQMLMLFPPLLLQNPQSSLWKDPALNKVNRFCRDSRCLDQWVPVINLPDRWNCLEY